MRESELLITALFFGIVAKKVLRKFESLSLGFMKDELTKFNVYLDKLFGKNAMPICKEYVEFLKRSN